MRKAFVFGILLTLSAYCFAQELVVTRIEHNGQTWWQGVNRGSWPPGDAGRQWDAVFNRYNLVRLRDSDDPFSPPNNPLIKQIGEESHFRVCDVSPAAGRYGFDPSTVYLTMGNRRFICFIYKRYGESYCYWVYEVK